MKIIKHTFAPGLASYGVTAYLKGNYIKTIIRIERAIKWLPEIAEDPVYNGYLGLALLKSSKNKKALPYLIKSVELFNSMEVTDKNDREIYQKLKNEIEAEIHKNT